MNIITAIQLAENGKLITNGILWFTHSYLNYVGNGVFTRHTIIGDDKVTYDGEVREFSMGFILSNDWRVVHELKIK